MPRKCRSNCCKRLSRNLASGTREGIITIVRQSAVSPFSKAILGRNRGGNQWVKSQLVRFTAC